VRVSGGWTERAKERRMVSEHGSAWVDVTDDGATLVVCLHGELDFAARCSVEPVVMAAITSATAVAVDLGDVRFCDSSGVAMFIAVAQKAETESTSLSIRNTPPNVRRIFQIAHLDHEIDVQD